MGHHLIGVFQNIATESLNKICKNLIFGLHNHQATYVMAALGIGNVKVRQKIYLVFNPSIQRSHSTFEQSTLALAVWASLVI